MTDYDLGDGVNLEHYVRDRDGALTAADVALVVTKPDGVSTVSPAITNPSTGRYRAATFVPDVAGPWTYTWTVSGAVTDVAYGSFTVAAHGAAVPLGGPYATLSQLKTQMGIPDTNTARDAELARRLRSASVDINNWCHRQFGRAEVATTREFSVGATGVDTDDFWTTDDLAIVPYLANVAGTAWDVATVSLEPRNGVVNQVPGWPYHRISMTWGDHPLWRAASWYGYVIRVTAKWGWAEVPENVVTSCLMLALADDKAKDAPFGVAGFGDYAVRIRQNPMVEEKLAPYVLDRLQVAS